MKRFERGAMSREVLEEIKEGDYVEAYGSVVNDDFLSDIAFMPNLVKKVDPPAVRKDDAKEKRVELHLHTNFSEMDGVCDIAEYIKTADAWGMDAIACGVRKVIILDGRVPHAILMEVLTDEGAGTMVVGNKYDK